MTINESVAAARKRWAGLTLYDQFEHLVIIFLTALIAVVIITSVTLVGNNLDAVFNFIGTELGTALTAGGAGN